MSIKKVYIVTSGSYSDYGINAVFLDKKIAEKYRKLEGVDDFEIEEWPVSDEALNLKIPKGYKPFRVLMNKDGSAKSRSGYDYAFSEDYLGAAAGKTYFGETSMWTSMFAKNKKHAIKIANERRVQAIAEDRWGKDDK